MAYRLNYFQPRKNFFIAAIVLFFCGSINAQIWSPRADYPGSARDDGSGFVIGAFGYCGTGFEVGFNTTADFYRFSFDSQDWQQVSSLPTGQDRQYAAGFTDGVSGYLFGGIRGGVFLNDLWKYDPAADDWTELAPMPGAPRSGSACFVIDGYAYIIGGKNATADALSELWRFDLTDQTWEALQPIPAPIWRASAKAVDGTGYLAFGIDSDLNYSNALWQYDPTADEWSALPSLPAAGRYNAALYNSGADLITFGGFLSNDVFLAETWRYSIDLNQWDATIPLPAAGRRGGMAFQDENTLYYTCGLTTGFARTRETWGFDLPTSVEEIEQTTFKISPNPATQFIHWQIAENAAPARLRIYSLQGTLQLELIARRGKDKIDISKLEAGLYIVVWESEDGAGTVKFVKH